ncbi:ARM repeat-containing protein [Cylindrobasidium torrendii FP15055 ss-10]|uniref:ARM repeat-containing protein n=1 Tax=Cylindrobasidium torrendii FP15055 ss-10 TaxID=1314674 RepID=A0A0D7B532_9AGAR|nr:ARM repeat-containing protein [Cylindrobasidium torrendii FP15055 ss-10]
MDLPQLAQLFSLTLSPDPNVHKKAELDILRIADQEGLVTALLQIIANNDVDLATRQSCAVWVKNRVFTKYPVKDGRKGDLTETDCATLRTSLLALISSAPSRPIALQLAQTLKYVIARSFPAKWSGLLDEVKALLSSSDVREVHAGCVAALEAVKAFRYQNKAEPLYTVVEALFPTLVSIATNMMQTPPSASDDIPALLHLILKTYTHSISQNLSPHQRSPESLVPWGRLLFGIVELNLPAEAVPADELARETCEWWKTKKWAYRTLTRLFHRYGSPSQLPTTMQVYQAFADHFVASFAPEILKTFLQQVELYISGKAWLSKKCQYHIFTFFLECIKPKSTWAQLKPHCTTLFTSFVFPLLTFTPERQAAWDEDPVDYVRLSVDEYEAFDSPVSAATSFLFGLVSNRTNTTFEPILAYVNGILTQPGVSDEQLFGALNTLAALGPWMMKHPKVKDNMEGLVTQHALPALTSSKPYLRAIACELIGTLVKNRMPITNETTLSTISTNVFNLLDDPEFPVKVNAILALTELIQASEHVAKGLSPQVAKIIQDILRLSDESELDILNHAMELLVDTYQTELLPVAAQLAQRLCDTYIRLVQVTMAADEQQEGMDLESIMAAPDDDKTLLAMGVAKTISTVIHSVDSSPEILSEVQEIVIPIVVFTLENKFLDLYDTVYELVDSLTFKLRAISPNMWRVFELTHSMFKSEAIDYLDEMLPFLDNCVSFGSAAIQARPEYKQMVVEIFTISMTSEHLGENDRVNGCKLAECMLLNLRGTVDEALQPIIQTTFAHLDEARGATLKLSMLEVLVNAVLYNATAALHIMGDGARKFFDLWFAAINAGGKGASKLPRVHDKRLSLLALGQLLEMDPSAIPEPVRDGWPSLLGGALKLFKEYPEAVKSRKELEESMQDDDDDDDSMPDRYLNFENDDDDVWDEDSAYLEMLAKEGARLREKNAKFEEGIAVDADEDSDEEDEDEDGLLEELGFFSPLDQVNVYQTFQVNLTAFQMKNSAAYATATTSLSMEQQTVLMEVMKLASEAQ